MKDKMCILESPTFLIAAIAVKNGVMEAVLRIMCYFPRKENYVLFMLEEKMYLKLAVFWVVVP
jgi:hypothetical protein